MTSVGIGGSFNSPEQFGLTPNPNLNEAPKEATKTSSQSGTGQNVVLSKDINEVPLYVKAGNIGFYQAAAGKPILDIAILHFRQLGEVDRSFDNQVQREYENLKSNLSEFLQKKLNANGMLPPEKRDPDVEALNLSLLFEAKLLVLCNGFAAADPSDLVLEAASRFQKLPDRCLHECLSFCREVLDSVEENTENLGGGHPAYGPMHEAQNEAKNTMNILKKYG